MVLGIFCQQIGRFSIVLQLYKAYSGTLTRPNSLGEIMFKFPYLALTRIISHKLAHSRNCKVDSNFNEHDPFNKLQTGPTGKSGPPFL